ncbi:hypothetical protein [Hoeflea sp.]|uniref:hypothetical protein n=1 Tax=Hoeflea sp. TaxID=1940281 RepID=UPI003747F7C2
MAGSRAEKLARLVRVQRQIERMAETQLSNTLRDQAVLDASQDALVEAVGSFDPVHAAMSHNYAQRFQRISAKSQQLEGIKSVQERRVLTEKTKADRLTDQAEAAAGNEERAAADEALLDLLESSLKRG